jgi:hypothetical protein
MDLQPEHLGVAIRYVWLVQQSGRQEPVEGWLAGINRCFEAMSTAERENSASRQLEVRFLEVPLVIWRGEETLVARAVHGIGRRNFRGRCWRRVTWTDPSGSLNAESCMWDMPMLRLSG